MIMILKTMRYRLYLPVMFSVYFNWLCARVTHAVSKSLDSRYHLVSYSDVEHCCEIQCMNVKCGWGMIATQFM